MNITEVITALEHERHKLDAAITALRGTVAVDRKTSWVIGGSAPAKRKRFSAETRAKMARSQKKRWMLRRKQEQAGAPAATV